MDKQSRGGSSRPTNIMQRKLKLPFVVGISLLGILLLSLIAFIKLPASSGTAPLSVIPPLRNEFKDGNVNLNKDVIDLSGWQPSSRIDYSELSNQLIGVIVRVQQGNAKTPDNAVRANGEDTQYKKHITGFQRRGIPVAVYAYIDGKSISAMKAEAQSFYNRAKDYKPTYWFLDVEEVTMSNMSAGVEAFRSELASLGVKNIGIYSHASFLPDNQIDTSKFSAVWLAAYGSDSGTYEGPPLTNLSYQLHQYTSRGQLLGYDGDLDLNRVTSKENYAAIFLNQGQS